METGMQSEAEAPFEHSVQDIAQKIFVSGNDSEEVQERKMQSGFYVRDKENPSADRLPRHNDVSFTDKSWLRNMGNFRDLIRIIAKDASVFKGREITENELRFILYSGAQAEISACKGCLARYEIFGQARLSIDDEPLSVSEVQARIKGLEFFQQELLERKT